MLKFSLQAQVAAEPLVRYVRALMRGTAPDQRLADEWPPELRALLTELTAQLQQAHQVASRDVSTHLLSVSSECREAGHALARIGQAQLELSRGGQETLDAIGTSSQEAIEQAQLVSSFSEAITSSITDVGGSIERLLGSLKGFHRLVDDSASQMVELSSAMAEIDQHTGNLSAQVQDISSTTAQLGANSRAMADQMREAQNLTEQMQRKAEEHVTVGGDRLQKHFQGIEVTVDESLRAIDDLREQSGSIGKIVTVIESITKQTNLLALNAAILAAQSGAEGKSFSIVADEIRALANRTSGSAKEIAGVIGTIQAGAQRATDAIGRCRQHIQESTQQSDTASTAMIQVIEASKQSAATVLTTVRAIAEQSKAVGLLGRSIDQVAELTQFIQRVASHHQDVSRRAMELAEQMRQASRQLGQEGDNQATATRRIVRSVEPMDERSRLCAKALRDQLGARQKLQGLMANASLDANALTEYANRLKQVSSTLQSLSARWETEPGVPLAKTANGR